MSRRIGVGIGAMLLVASMVGGVLASESAAGATSTATLYVRHSGTGSTCTGSSTADACSSIQTAVTLADHDAGAMTITVGPGTYTEHDISVTTNSIASLTIKGAGASSTTIDGGTLSWVFDVVGQPHLTIEELSITHGQAGDGYGGGIDTYGDETLVLENDTFSTDHAGSYGGAVNLTFDGHASFVDDTFSTDKSGGAGGAIQDFYSTLVMSGVTFHTDTAPTGGAIDDIAGNVTIKSSTIVGSSCHFTGEGFFTTDPGSLTFTDDISINATGCGPSTIAATVCIPATHECKSHTSETSQTSTVSSEDVTVTASGRGKVAVGTYGKDPAGVLAGSTDRFFGVSVSTGNSFTSVVVKDCNLAKGVSLVYWNGHAWAPVVGQGGTTYTSTCITFKLGKTSTPKLSVVERLSSHSRFGAVVFGIAGYPKTT